MKTLSGLILKYKRLIKFLIVGVSGVFVNMLFLWFFKEIAGLDLKIAGILAIEISVVSNFILNNYWTFNKLNLKTSIFSRFFKYNFSVIIGIGINYVVLLLLTKPTGSYLIANLIGIGLATISNYLFSSRWAWKK